MRKAIGVITVITAVIITVYYLTICGLRGNESALSTVGLEHHTIFTLWEFLHTLPLQPIYQLHF